VYCLLVTDTIDSEKYTTKNGLDMIKGRCSICGANKARFVGRTLGGWLRQLGFIKWKYFLTHKKDGS